MIDKSELIAEIKRRAKTAARQDGISHEAYLNAEAQKNGYKNWGQLQKLMLPTPAADKEGKETPQITFNPEYDEARIKKRFDLGIGTYKGLTMGEHIEKALIQFEQNFANVEEGYRKSFGRPEDISDPETSRIFTELGNAWSSIVGPARAFILVVSHKDEPLQVYLHIRLMSTYWTSQIFDGELIHKIEETGQPYGQNNQMADTLVTRDLLERIINLEAQKQKRFADWYMVKTGIDHVALSPDQHGNIYGLLCKNTNIPANFRTEVKPISIWPRSLFYKS